MHPVVKVYSSNILDPYSVLSSPGPQENKTESISLGVAHCLVKHLGSKNLDVVKLSCRALEGICTVSSGRQEMFNAGGVKVLTDALTRASIEPTSTFKVLEEFAVHYTV